MLADEEPLRHEDDARLARSHGLAGAVIIAAAAADHEGGAEETETREYSLNVTHDMTP